MELAGQQQFIVGGSNDRRTSPERLSADEMAYVVGERLLLSAARMLARPDVASIGIELRGGGSIDAVHALRIDGPVAHTSSRRGVWEHCLAIDRVIGIRTAMAGDAPLGAPPYASSSASQYR